LSDGLKGESINSLPSKVFSETVSAAFATDELTGSKVRTDVKRINPRNSEVAGFALRLRLPVQDDLKDLAASFTIRNQER
jgi:hypothetical protein